MAEKKQKQTKKPLAERDDNVVVSREGLNNLIKQNEDLLSRVTRLESAGDKSRLAKYDSKFFKRGPNIFTLSVYEGKIITGWRTLKNVSYKDPRTGMVVEDQQYELLFDDNSKLTVSGYLAFSDIRYNETVQAEEVSRTTDEKGTNLRVKIIDQTNDLFGKELSVDIRVLN